MTSLEAQRLENIRQQQALLANLNIKPLPHTKPKPVKNTTDHVSKKRKLVHNIAPTRSSARISARQISPDPLQESHQLPDNYVDVELPRRRPRPSKPRPAVKHEYPTPSPESLIPKRNAEELRASWSEWEATAPSPMRDADGTLHFESHSDFTPNKTPEEILREGAFGGSYFRPYVSKRLGILVEDDWRELPKNWLRGLDVKSLVASSTYDPAANRYGVSCGQSIEEWEAQGWIDHEYDVRGWFQWYCRFYQGRRCDDDERQVGRWRKCVGQTGRWRRMLLKRYGIEGQRSVCDPDALEDKAENSERALVSVSPVMHQTCLHWAWTLTQEVLDDYWHEQGG
ncbi:MAG: hypothetical protein Q9227_000689 [Pyrenula ochraceoflavens]